MMLTTKQFWMGVSLLSALLLVDISVHTSLAGSSAVPTVIRSRSFEVVDGHGKVKAALWLDTDGSVSLDLGGKGKGSPADITVTKSVTSALLTSPSSETSFIDVVASGNGSVFSMYGNPSGSVHLGVVDGSGDISLLGSGGNYTHIQAGDDLKQ